MISSPCTPFQSTLPRRERHGYENTILLPLGISIHAPAKGATIMKKDSFVLYTISIHAPAKGATSGYLYKSTSTLIFQSTLPRRERHDDYMRSERRITDFNPRSREGSDHRKIEKRVPIHISIHAPAKGATAILSNFISYIFQFSLIFTNIFLLIFYF